MRAPNSPATGRPAITGNLVTGQTLTADTSGIADADGLGTFRYQWVRADDASGTDAADISSATNSTYTLTADDVGKHISVKVSFSDGDSNSEGPLESPRVGPVAAPELELTVSDSAITESVVRATVTVSITNGGTFATDQTIELAFAGTAVAGLDYVSPGNSLTLLAGQDSVEVTIVLIQDDLYEAGGETIIITASHNSNRVGELTIAIEDQEDKPVLALSVSDAAIAENGGTSTVTVAITNNKQFETLPAITLSLAGTATEVTDYTIGSKAPGYNDRRRWATTITGVRDMIADNGETIVITASDGAGTVGTATITIAENNLPTAADREVTTDEDTAYTFAAPDFNYADADNHGLAGVKIVSVETAGDLELDGSDVTAGQVVTAAQLDNGELTFTPAANDNGNDYASFTFRVNDGEDDSADAYTLTIDVDPVNDAPAAANKTVTTKEDTAYRFQAGDFGFADVDTGDTLASVKVTALESAGSLKHDGDDLTLNQVITRADIDAGKLAFEPAANANGAAYASFTFKVNDGTADSADAYTLTIDVDAANDAATGAPAITGNAVTGQALSADTSAIADADGLGGVSYSYQWLRADDASGAGAAEIPSATGSSYTPTAADAGKYLILKVSFTDDGGGAESLQSAAVGPVTGPVLELRVSDSDIAENGGTSTVTVAISNGATFASDQAIELWRWPAPPR